MSGRWFGVRGRRFVRPVLTIDVAGDRRRLVALLDHKPWHAADGEPWVAAFPWEGAREAAGDGRARGRQPHRRAARARRRGRRDRRRQPAQPPPRARRPGEPGRPAAAPAEAVELHRARAVSARGPEERRSRRTSTSAARSSAASPPPAPRRCACASATSPAPRSCARTPMRAASAPTRPQVELAQAQTEIARLRRAQASARAEVERLREASTQRALGGRAAARRRRRGA